MKKEEKRERFGVMPHSLQNISKCNKFCPFIACSIQLHASHFFCEQSSLLLCIVLQNGL